jgi:DNA-directed RNA polymerase specialized sigma24 family protein
MTERDQIRTAIKRRLNSYRDLLTERAQLEEELKKVEALMTSPSSTHLDGMPRSHSGPSDPVQHAVVKRDELRTRYKTKIAEMLEEQTAIETLIDSLEPTERKLARYRYIDGLTWEEVSEKMNYGTRQPHRIHDRMIEKLVNKALKNQ